MTDPEFDTSEDEIDAMLAEGRRITDAINADPEEVRRLRAARREVRAIVAGRRRASE